MSNAGDAPSKIRHVPGLDGLRGAAVIGVLFFHADGRLPGGYLGVDLFFVLSGFLITSILLEEHRRTGAIALRTFWIRRARRLLPALLSLMPAVAIYARVLASPTELTRLRYDALATLAYVANWRAVVARRSYWDMFAAPSPLEHTWSLAIEEQFYVAWPVVVIGVLAFARGRLRAMFPVCVALGLGSCAAMFLLHDGGATTRVYLGTDTRGAAILAGAALASADIPRGAARRYLVLDALGVLAAIGLGVAWARLDGQSDLLYRGGFWATEVAGVILIACSVWSPDGPVARALSSRPLRAVGAVSYGVYLWHWPLYVVLTEARIHVGGLALLGVRLAATFAVAGVSYRLLERPIRERGLAWGRPAVVVPGAFALAVAAILVSTRGGLGAAATVDPTRTPPTIAVIQPPVPEASAGPPPPPVDSFLAASELPPGAIKTLVLGDSVAMSLGIKMYWARREGDPYVVQRAVGDCTIMEGIVPVQSWSGDPHGNGNCAQSWLADVAELRPDVALVLFGGAYFSKFMVGGRWCAACDEGWRDVYARRLAALLRSIAPHVARRVVVLPPFPVGRWESLHERAVCFLRTLRDAARAGNAEVMDLGGHMCPDRGCTLTSEGEEIRPDGLHFGDGASEVARWTMDEVRRAQR